MLVLGLSAYYHDSAAALLRDGAVVAAAQEERFTRVKHDARFPAQAVDFCLQDAGVALDDVDAIVFYEKPFLKFERLLETYLATAPRGFRSFRAAMPIWIKQKLFQKRTLRKELEGLGGHDVEARLLFAEHHQSHAASAFFPSPFERAVVVTMDGVGEWATTSVCIGNGNALETQREIHFPHSLGLLYSAFTYYTGFKVNSGEYKVMGLAPYGEPKYATRIRDHLIDIKPDGSFHVAQEYFDYATGLAMTNSRFDDLFGGPPREPEGPLTQREMDLAASVQVVTEEAVSRLTANAAKESGERNLCLAGGVALNCVANGKLLRSGPFENIWVQPAAGDAGGALGAAYAAWHQHFGKPRQAVAGCMDAMRGSFLGPRFNDDAIEERLQAVGAVVERLDGEAAAIALAAGSLAAGEAVGWFQGRMEFGPRALGARSILADPRGQAVQKTLNLKIKYRESFRPFAPAVLSEDAAQWFDLDAASPYMLLVADVAAGKRVAEEGAYACPTGLDKLDVPRSTIPAVTHVDHSARVQTVHRETNPRFHALLTAFKARTGCPVLVNTSFNVRGEPIVCTPEDAFRCLMGTELDLLVAGNIAVRKAAQDPALREDYKNRFRPD